MIATNAPLVSAFPESVREEATAAISALPECPHHFSAFSVQVAGESLSIPERVRHDPLGISAGFRLGFRCKLAREILDCIFTRHANGFVRQEYLRRIIHSNNIWIPPFVIRLAGEYVIEILRDIESALERVDLAIYGEFVRNNPAFVQQTKQRIVSYWDCYHRSTAAEKYPGFRILSLIEELERRPGERRA